VPSGSGIESNAPIDDAGRLQRPRVAVELPANCLGFGGDGLLFEEDEDARSLRDCA
jgi:hypothetical protein